MPTRVVHDAPVGAAQRSEHEVAALLVELDGRLVRLGHVTLAVPAHADPQRFRAEAPAIGAQR